MRAGMQVLNAYVFDRFLQDSLQTQLILPYMDGDENDKLVDLAKLYSLRIEIDNDRAIFYKTM